MVILTGANGFIGSAMAWQLNQDGFTDLICVDSVGLQTHDLLKGKRYKSFLNHQELMPFLKSLGKRDVTHVLHMGACSSTTEMNVEFLKENNFEYTRRLWSWCTENQVPYIYASSGAVYGDGTLGFDDGAPPSRYKPLNPYGESKAMFDRWAIEQTQTPPQWYGLRFFNVFGPNEYFKKDMASLVFKAYGQIQSTGRLKLFRSHNPDYKDGHQLRDFVYIKDVTRWMSELMKMKVGKSGIYNMGFGKARSWLDLANAAFGTLGRPMQIDWIDVPEDIRPRYQYFTEAKMDRSFALGLSRPQWSLEKGVEDYIRNYLDEKRLGQRQFL